MSTSQSLILVTGASGFLGSHVVHQLLEAGYRVRGTVRSRKVALTQEGWTDYKDQFEAVAVDDLVSGDLSAALQGVTAVIHTAAPLAGKQDAESSLNVAIEGSLNVLRQAEELGITRFVYISSIITVADTSKIVSGATDQDWNPVTREQALAPGAEPFVIYAAEKKLAEIAVWEFAESHPHIDVTAFNPPFLYGPFAPGFRAPEANLSSLSTNAYVYQLLQPNEGLPRGPRFTDVRDVARGCVNALTSPTTAEVGRKRILVTGEWFSFHEAVEYIAEVRPELRARLNKAAFSAGPAPRNWIDNTRAREVVGLREMTPWRKSLIAAVDSLIKLEKEWASKGLTPA
ncbi:NAD-P-binding protein [Obba rivulosa]|uniref:NAD-P-binding protein n=1 Tax=Obba rivulosa TaxID=1052685 RepID=A0A8E2ALW1_9APHY|nr:NAD-P-binding protein [Obba rivulosa]